MPHKPINCKFMLTEFEKNLWNIYNVVISHILFVTGGQMFQMLKNKETKIKVGI